MFSYALRSGLVALVLAGRTGDDWPAPPPMSSDEFARERQEWRENLRERLVRPFSGVILWMGLWELAQGATPFGSDPDLRIVLPQEDSPPLAGTIHRSGQKIRIEPSLGSPLTIREGERITAKFEPYPEPRALPPRENRLRLAVTGGEKRPDPPAY